MTEYINPFSKTAQLSRSPGNRKKQSSQSKGAEFEKSVQGELQKTSKTKVRRNHQGRTGGGMGQADISTAQGWHFEVKNENTLRMPAYHKQLAEDCPKDKKPGLVYRNPVDGKPWVSIELEKRNDFAASIIEAAGGEVYFPE